MAKLATCPGCTTQLALPEEATLSDRARCPRCHEEFLLMETVQFSIPTAEILPPASPEPFNATDTVSPSSYTPASDPYSPEQSGDDSSTDFEPRDESLPSFPSPEVHSETLPPSATLSDWEARLKRAIAGDSEDKATAPVGFEFNEPVSHKSPSAEPVTYEPQDFSVDDADLVPSVQKSDISDSATVASGEHGEDEPTVNFAGDQTVSDFSAVKDFEEPRHDVPSIRADGPAPRRSRKQRSFLRTLASASMGIVGIPLGLYALLWLRGPAGDMLHIAQYLPSFMLPADFDSSDFDNSSGQLVNDSVEHEPSESVTTDETLASNNGQPDDISDAAPLIREDASVEPASAELPVYQGPTFDLVDANEFGKLLAAAEQAAPQLSEGDLKTKESVASKGQAYMALARLANKGAFLNQPGHSAADAAKALEAEQLLQSILQNETARRDLPQIALRWWQYAQRPSPGIVLAGEVTRLQRAESGTLVFVSLGVDNVAPEIPVLVSRADYHEGETIGVAGSIEVNPQDKLPAIDASLGPVVIAHTSFSLDAAPTVPTPNGS